MYRPSDQEIFANESSDMPRRRKMYQAYTKAVQSNSEEDWLAALKIKEEYEEYIKYL